MRGTHFLALNSNPVVLLLSCRSVLQMHVCFVSLLHTRSAICFACPGTTLPARPCGLVETWWRRRNKPRSLFRTSDIKVVSAKLSRPRLPTPTEPLPQVPSCQRWKRPGIPLFNGSAQCALEEVPLPTASDVALRLARGHTIRRRTPWRTRNRAGGRIGIRPRHWTSSGPW